MRRSRLVARFLVAVLLVAACGGGGAPAATPVPTSPPTPAPSAGPTAGPTTSPPATASPSMSPPATGSPAAHPSPPPTAPPGPVAGTIAASAPVLTADIPVDPDVDTEVRQRSADPLADGLTMSVPAGAYAAPVSLALAVAPIVGSTFGPLVTPVSHLVTVEVDGSPTAALPVAIRIPVRAAPEATLGAFFHDPETGALEPLPLADRDETSVTVLTRHFSSIFVAAAEAILPDALDSGFTAAADGWQFGNKGTYPEPEGFCSGAATSAMWYFLTQHRGAGAPHLYGLSDNDGRDPTPGFDRDDALGLRFVSVVQHATDWNGIGARFFWRSRSIGGAAAYQAFRYAMAVTGEPQLVLVGRPGGWHAMVVTAVHADRLAIWDPNFPGQARAIPYVAASGTLGPYVGSLTYPQILFAAKTAIAPWSQIAGAWERYLDGTIGDDLFPPVQFFVDRRHEDQGVEALVPGYETTGATIRLAYNVSVDGLSLMTRYIGSAPVAYDVRDLTLEEGANTFGLYVEGKLAGGDWEWIQFKRFTIIRTVPEPTEPPEHLMLTIEDEATVDAEGTVTCPAEITLSFFRKGGKPGTIFGKAELNAMCTDREFMAIHAAGTFDGTTFSLSQGRFTWSGTFDDGVAMIEGGPGDLAYIFAAP